MSTPPPASLADPVAAYSKVRAFSEALCEPLEPEDLVPQSMPDASHTKWHLAHTTWFFETFVLEAYERDFRPFHPDFRFLFNSYYNAVGERHARPARGLLTRPTLAEVFAYRRAVDERVQKLCQELDGEARAEALGIVELGLHHEQQHQELMLTDLKHLFAQNAMGPAYRAALPGSGSSPSSMGWQRFADGVFEIGHRGEDFAFDNESPAHPVFLGAFALADRLVTNAEYLAFIEDGGYRRPELWLNVGWSRVQEEAWQDPIYWQSDGDGYREFTLAGWRELAQDEPVSHLSFVEAHAFANWAGARLPSEAEWEVASGSRPVEGNFVDSGRAHPAPAPAGGEGGLRQLFGDLWEWTQSAYAPYPGYRAAEGALGEYNGKFMCEQLVLRGGSCASSRSHLRASYRNFFYAPDRWQFSGLRLAKDL
jgi:ergothioneine biosynthesis protein EgtB